MAHLCIKYKNKVHDILHGLSWIAQLDVIYDSNLVAYNSCF